MASPEILNEAALARDLLTNFPKLGDRAISRPVHFGQEEHVLIIEQRRDQSINDIALRMRDGQRKALTHCRRYGCDKFLALLSARNSSLVKDCINIAPLLASRVAAAAKMCKSPTLVS